MGQRIHFSSPPSTQTIVVVIAVIISALIPSPIQCKPAKNSQNETETAKDLKYTFANEDEIPAGFKAEGRNLQQPIQFNTCKDGSGGICIPVGQCAEDLKPTIPNEDACDAGEECCFGGPPAGTPCKNRGGECVEASMCGNNPAQLKSDTECDHENGETCCIWLF